MQVLINKFLGFSQSCGRRQWRGELCIAGVGREVLQVEWAAQEQR